MFVLKAAKVEVPYVKNIEKQKQQNWSGDMSTVSVQFWFNVNSDSLKLNGIWKFDLQELSYEYQNIRAFFVSDLINGKKIR